MIDPRTTTNKITNTYLVIYIYVMYNKKLSGRHKSNYINNKI